MSAPAPMPIASASSPAKAARPAFLATAADEVTRSLLSKTAGLRGLSGERVVIGGVPEVTKALAGTPTPRLLIIDFSKSADPAADADALADVCDPGTLVIGLGTVNDVGLYRYLTGLGLSDYLVKPCSVEMLSDAIERAEQDAEAEALRGTVKPEVDPSNKTRKIMVTASRGGAGAGTVALSLAWLFSHHHQRNSVLVDLDLEFGTAALALDLQPGRGLADALAAPDRVDALFLDRAMLKDGEHFSLLATEQALDGAEALNADSVSTLIKALAEGRDRLVLDTPRRFLAENPYIAADMDALVLVTDLSIAGMRDTLRLANLIKAHAPDCRLVVVGNKVGYAKTGELSRAAFEKGAELSLEALIPFDLQALTRCMEKARPLAEVAGGSKAGKALTALAADLDHVEGEEAPKPQGLFARLLHR